MNGITYKRLKDACRGDLTKEEDISPVPNWILLNWLKKKIIELENCSYCGGDGMDADDDDPGKTAPRRECKQCDGTGLETEAKKWEAEGYKVRKRTCPTCKKEHEEWHGKEVCFACATDEQIKNNQEMLKILRARKKKGLPKNERRNI